MSSKIKIVNLDPNKIKIPEIRITSTWDDEEYKTFQESIKADGIATPLLCVKEGEDLWLVDGLHRLQESKLQGAKSIPVAYKEGTLIDAMTRNLYMNRLRGKTKASEEVRLVRYLLDKEKMSLYDIEKKTGLSKDKLDQLLTLGNADPLVLKALDEEELKIGHAFNLARIQSKAGQLKLLTALRTMIPFPTISYVKEVVDSTLEIVRQHSEDPQPPQPSLAIPTVQCTLCEQEFPLPRMVGITVDRTCLGLAIDYIQELKRKRAPQKSEAELLAQKIAAAEPNRRTEPSSE